MTPRDRATFADLFGYDPCYKTWAPLIPGLPGSALVPSHLCTRNRGHKRRCACCCEGRAHIAPEGFTGDDEEYRTDPDTRVVGLSDGFLTIRHGIARFHDGYNQVWVLRPTVQPDIPLEIILESR